MGYYSSGNLLSNKEEVLVELIRSKNSGKFSVEKFTKKIAWVQDTEATPSLFYKNYCIEEYSTFIDYYGYGESSKSAIEFTEGLMKKMQFDKKDPNLQFKIFQTIKNTPCILEKEPEPNKRLVCNGIENSESLWLFNEELINELIDLLNNKTFQERHERVAEIKKAIHLDVKLVSEGVQVWSSSDV